MLADKKNLDQLLSYLVALIFIAFLTIISPQQVYTQVTVGNVVSVTNGDDSYSNKSPRIGVNSEGEIIVFWMRTGNEAFFFSTLESDGFSTPTQIPFGGLNPNLWSGSLGPNMASGGGHIYVTFEVYGDAIYVTHSPDNGLTWETPVIAFIPPQGRRATIPTIAVDEQGQPYVAYVNTNAQEGDAHYGLVRSLDHGMSYTTEVVVNENAVGPEVCECCNGDIGIAPNGDVYVAFRNNNENLRDIWLARSTDGGQSFNTAFDIDETDWTSGVCPSNGPHILAQDESVTSVFYSGSTSWGNGIYSSEMNALEETVSVTDTLPPSDESSTQQNRPRIAGIGDTLAVVWQENINGSLELAMTYSTTGIEGLGEELIQLTEMAGSQRYPDIVYHDGRFHIVFEDVSSGTVNYLQVFPGIVGLNEFEKVEFEVYPNPTKDVINLGKSEITNGRIQIVNSLGKVCIEDYFPQGELFDISSLESGTYTLFILTTSGLSHSSFIKH